MLKKVCLIFITLCLILGLCCCSNVDNAPIKYEFFREDGFKTSEGDIIIKESEGYDAFRLSFDEVVALYFNALIDDINDSNGKDSIDIDNVFYKDVKTQIDAVKDSGCDATTKAIVYEINVNILAVRYAVAEYNADKTEENFDNIISCMDKAHEVYTSYVK